MNPFQTSVSSSGTGLAVLLSVITGLFGVAIAVLWLWIGWRAMRAHERIAESLASPERPTS